MKFLKTLAITFLSFIIFQSSASASAKQINWFFKTRSEGAQPEILGGDSIADDYNAVYMGKEGDKTVYLTFDAGYSNENVVEILDVLKAHDAKAAFFILPGIIKNSPEAVQRMIDDGHLICNHSYSHGNMANITEIEEFKDELLKLEQVYKNAFDEEMAKYFRPPEGAFSVQTLEFCNELGYTPVFWSFAYADWDNGKQPDTEKAKQKMLGSLHDGMVILLHPTSKTNALILDEVLTEIENRNYSFGTLDELKEKQNG